jgi:hypothetical protein
MALAPRLAHADPTVPACLAANDKSIELRGKHQLIESRAALLVCASGSCPAEIRDECTRKVEEINAAIPSVVFEAKDGDGKDLTDVRVTMDGAVLAEHLQGTSFPLDPGTHSLVFETTGVPPHSEQIVVVEGVKDRHVSVTLGEPTAKSPQMKDSSPTSPTSPTSSGSTQRLLGWTVVGAGVVGLGVGLVFELQRSSKLSDRDAICPTGTCASKQDQLNGQARIDQLTSEAKTAGTVATVGFVAGGVLAAGGLVLVFTAPTGSREIAFAPVVAPGFDGLAAVGRF